MLAVLVGQGERGCVVADHEHTTRITYNPHGQPTAVTESGFSPIGELDQGGTHVTPNQGTTAVPIGAISPITRTTTYRYTRVNGRSVLTHIDGPLANGPQASAADSDITQLQWDERGSMVTAIVQPGGYRSEVHYDDAARIAQVRSDDGALSRYRYTAAGQLGALERRTASGAAETHTFDFDAQGRLVETGVDAGLGAGFSSGPGTGTERSGSHRPQTRMAYDSADRLLWRAHALGWAEQWRRDTEGRVIEAGHYSAQVVQSTGY